MTATVVEINPTVAEMDALLGKLGSEQRPQKPSMRWATLEPLSAQIEQMLTDAENHANTGSIQSSSPEDMSEWTPEALQQVKNYANQQPKTLSEQVAANKANVPTRLGQGLTGVYLSFKGKNFKRKLPSLDTIYVQMSELEREHVKLCVFDPKNLRKEGFTKAEVDAMLRRFLLLDRLVMSPEEVKAEQQRLANLAYNLRLDPDEAANNRDGMLRVSIEQMDRQRNYNARKRWLGRGPREPEVAEKKVDLKAIESYFVRMFERAQRQIHHGKNRSDQGIGYRDQKTGIVAQPGENHPLDWLNGGRVRGTKLFLAENGIKGSAVQVYNGIRNSLSRSLQIAAERSQPSFGSVHNDKTGEQIVMFGSSASQIFGKNARGVIEREMVR